MKSPVLVECGQKSESLKRKHIQIDYKLAIMEKMLWIDYYSNKYRRAMLVK